MTAKSSIKGIENVEKDNGYLDKSKKHYKSDKDKKESQKRDYPL